MNESVDNLEMKTRIQKAIDEINFAIEFAKTGALVTVPILEGIKKRLETPRSSRYRSNLNFSFKCSLCRVLMGTRSE